MTGIFSTSFPLTLRKNAPILLAGALALGGLFQISQWNYLLFHSLAEMFSTVIAISIFVITWNTRRYLDNKSLLLLGIAFLFVGVVGLLHALAYQGLGVFPGTAKIDLDGANLATQLWLATRLVTAVSFAAAPFVNQRRFSPLVTMASFAVLSALLLVTIFTGIFPDSYLGGTGLTPFKKISEYGFIVLFLLGLFGLVRARVLFSREVFILLLYSIFFNIAAEVMFIIYISVTGLTNMLGHFFIIIAFYLLYKAIVETGFLKPYNLLFRELAQREQELRLSEQRERARAQQVEAMMDIVPAVVWIAHDPQLKDVSGNKAAMSLLRRASEQDAFRGVLLKGEEAFRRYQVFDPLGHEIPVEERPLQRAAITGAPVRDVEERVILNNGEERLLYGGAAPLLDESGRTTGAVSAFIDITERARFERELHESEVRFRTLFETMSEGFLLQELLRDEQGRPFDFRILDANPAYIRWTGRARDEVVGRTAREILQEVPPAWFEYFVRSLETNASVQYEDYSPLARRYLDVIVSPVGDDVVASLAIDVTERRRSQQALRESEARLRRLVDSDIIGVMISHDDGTIPVANDAFLDTVGYNREDFEAGLVNWKKLTPAEFAALDQRGIEEANERGACTPYEKEFLHKDGRHVPVLIGYACISEAQPEYICFIIDLTSQKRAEEAARRAAAEARGYAARLERSNTELQNFAFVASHDLQEPLRKIQAFGERLNDRLSEGLDDETRDYLERMLNAAIRMRAMINDLLALSRVTTQGRPFEQVDLNEIIGEVLSDLEMRIERSGGTVEVGDLPVVDADPIQMNQLFQNLITNGLKFHRPNVIPQVRLYNECPPGAQDVMIFVEDNGIGFDEQYIERIFQPFQRLHGMGQYEGSGIGLAICRKIVERHSGTLTAKSTPGQGATFIIRLPVRQPARQE